MELHETFLAHRAAILWVISQQVREPGLSRSPIGLAMAEMWERHSTKAQAFADTLWHKDMKRPNGIRLREWLIVHARREFVSTTGRIPRSGVGPFDRYVYETCVFVCKAELASHTLKRLGTAKWEGAQP